MFKPGDRVRWITRDVEGTVLDDHAEDFPDFIAIQWDNSDRTFSAPTHIQIQAVKSRDASPKSVTAEETNIQQGAVPMVKTIKAPVMVRGVVDLAVELGMTPSEVWAMLDATLGADWWDGEPEEFTFSGYTAGTGGAK